MSERKEMLIPALGVITDIRIDTPDVKPSGFSPVTVKSLLSTDPDSAQCSLFPASERQCSP